MIEVVDGGFSLRCTDCDSRVKLTEAEVGSSDKRLMRMAQMKHFHTGCNKPGTRAYSKAQGRTAR